MHERDDVAAAGHGLGIREVERGLAEVLADEIDRTVELGRGLRPRDAIEQPVGVGVRSDVDQSSRARVAQRGPRHRPAARRHRDLPVDEPGGEVQRGRHPVPLEDGNRELGEVGGAVVERDHDRRVGRALAGRGGQLRERTGERHGPSRLGDHRDLLVESRRVEVDLERGAAAHPVVQQDHDTRDARAPAVGRGRRDLHAAPEDRASGRHGRIPRGGTRRARAALRRTHAPCASRDTTARRARAARANAGGRGDRSCRTPGT